MALDQTATEARGRRLDGWKSIASYLGTSTKTAMRWEAEEAMPVHRHAHAERSSVFAFEPELDGWRVRRQPKTPMTESVQSTGPSAASLETDRLPNDVGDDQIGTAPRGCPPPAFSTVFLGRDGDLQRLRDGLTMQAAASVAPSQVIVTGVPGIGKTTLAAVLSRDRKIVEAYPDGVLWTCLDKTPMLISTMATWGRALGIPDLLRVATVEDAATALRHALQNRRMLLMVDDVWEEDHGAVFQKVLSARCGLVFTTRLPKVAESLSQTGEDIHVVRKLDHENAVRLISLLAPMVVRQFPGECGQLVEDLECLPLAIHVAARLLRKRIAGGLQVRDLLTSIRQGSALIEAKAPSDRVLEGTIPTVRALLKKSTDMLDPETRRCFADLASFAPKPASFDLDAMKHVCDVPDATPLAEELVDCGLLEPVEEGRFQMHALLVAHAQTLEDY